MKALKGEVLPPPPKPEPKQPKQLQEEEKPKRGLGKLVADIRQGEKDKVMEMRANRESRAIERQKAFDEKRAHLVNHNKSALLAHPNSTVREHIADQLEKDPQRKFRKDVSAFHDSFKALKGEVLPPPPQLEPKQPKKVQEEEKPKRGLGKLVADIRQGEKDKVMEMRANRESRAIERQKAFDEKRAHLVNQNKSALLAQPTSTVREHIADQLARDPRRKFRKDV